MINNLYKYPKICLVFFLLFVFSLGWGQSLKKIKRQISFRSLAHVKGIEQYGAGGGVNNDGFDASLFYTKYLKKNLFVRGDLFYEKAALSNITTLQLFYVSPEVNYTIAKLSNRFFVNIKGGLIIGNERLSNGIMVNKKLSTVIFGEKIGVKFEFFIIPELSMNLDFEQRFINNSKAGVKSALAYVSLSYNL
jgi:hypothetical protein